MNETIYRQLSLDIEKHIREQRLTGRLPGIRKYCRELGCHHVTLTKALRLLEERGIVSIRNRGGTYVLSKTKRNYRTIGIVGGGYPLATHFPETLALLKKWNYHYMHISFDQALFHENPRILLNFPVDGFVFRMSSLRMEQLTFLKREDIPFITTDCFSPVGGVNAVTSNHAAAYRHLLLKLRSLGHRRIGFVEFRRIPEYMFYLERIHHAFTNSLGSDFRQELFFTPCTKLEFCDRHNSKDIGRLFAYAALRYFAGLPELPDAIIAPDELAIQLNRLLKEYQFKIPEDISIAGVFRDSPFDGLDGVVFNNRQILQSAVEYLLNRLADDANTGYIRLVSPHTIKGHSIGPHVPPKRQLWSRFLNS